MAIITLGPRLRAAVALSTVAITLTAFAGVAGAAGTAGRFTRDSDHDGMPNIWERRHDLDPHQSSAKWDPDKDGLRNIAEFDNRIDPHAEDSDGDGLDDGAEVKKFDSDPGDTDSDGDGIEDGDDDSDGDGVADEGEDGDHEGFVGTVVGTWDEGHSLRVATLEGESLVFGLTGETSVKAEKGCDVTDADQLLVEGNDVIEVRIAEVSHHVPVLAAILLACPSDV
jgi:hypothetical protein